MRITRLGPGMYRVVDGTMQQTAWVVGPRYARWVFVDGRVYVIDTTAAPGSPRRAGYEDAALAAPMPATVAAIHVTPGQPVARGDLLVMLEAMKMELPIRAPRDAHVKAIRCELRQLVQPGVPLVELEPELTPNPEP